MDTPSPDQPDKTFSFFNVPTERRIQTLVVLIALFLQLLSLVFNLAILFSPLMPLLLLYCIVIYFDKDASRYSNRVSPTLRGHKVWTYFRDFFPISLVATEKLDPKQKYVFGYHPHGIISVGAFCNFATEATGMSAKLEGIDLRLLTLRSNFFLPFFREYLLSLGMADVSNDTCQHLLKSGKSIMIVIGGAAESLDAHPDETCYLTLKNRKGFVRVAIQNGAWLVPVFSFGEVDIFDQVENPRGSTLRRFQTRFQKLFGFTCPLFYGRGIFNYKFGLLPFRRPITTIVGSPIPVTMNEHPSKEEIDYYHEQYMNKLQELFEANKEQYLTKANKLVFV